MKEVNFVPISHNALSLYAEVCKPVCRELEIPQTAFDILMYIAEHDEYTTAKKIVELGGIKKNLVSMNVEKLVQQGYIIRKEDPGDRRRVRLELTDKASAIVEKGKRVQKYYFEFLVKGLSEEDLEIYRKCTETISSNMDELQKELKK